MGAQKITFFKDGEEIQILESVFETLRKVSLTVGLFDSPNFCFLFGNKKSDGTILFNECIGKKELINASKSDKYPWTEEEKLLRSLFVVSECSDIGCEPVCCSVIISPRVGVSTDDLLVEYHEKKLKMRKRLQMLRNPMECLFAVGGFGFLNNTEPLRICLPDSFGGIEYTDISVISHHPNYAEVERTKN